MQKMLEANFFNRDPQIVARQLLGKVLRHYVQNTWLSALIIETEAYYIHDKASHASLGYTEKRKALFMPAGTIYMYYSRAGDSLNISCKGQGNAVLIKSGLPQGNDPRMLALMQKYNPPKNISVRSKPALSDFNSGSERLKLRPVYKLCSGQSLLCKALCLKVKDWDQKTFDPEKLRIDNIGYKIKKANIIQTTRLGITQGRDEHFPYRFISGEHVKFCTAPPKTRDT